MIPRPTASRLRERGQSLAEFALIVPLMFFLAIAVGDFGRLYTSAVAAESAAREAADYGAFLGSSAWNETNAAQLTLNESEMVRRACTATAQMPDYAEPVGTINHATCTNPAVTYDLVRPSGVTNCSTPASTETPCKVHVRVRYTFHTLVPIGPIPATMEIVRDSWFAISDLPAT